MSGFDDDALRDMLTSRADRLTPNAPGEVMVRVRAEVRGPRQGAAFSVLPVLTGRSPAMGAGWAAAIMVAVLVMVIVGTRPATVATPSSAGAGTTVVSPSVSPSSLPSATRPEDRFRTHTEKGPKMLLHALLGHCRRGSGLVASRSQRIHRADQGSRE